VLSRRIFSNIWCISSDVYKSPTDPQPRREGAFLPTLGSRKHVPSHVPVDAMPDMPSGVFSASSAVLALLNFNNKRQTVCR